MAFWATFLSSIVRWPSIIHVSGGRVHNAFRGRGFFPLEKVEKLPLLDPTAYWGDISESGRIHQLYRTKWMSPSASDVYVSLGQWRQWCQLPVTLDWFRLVSNFSRLADLFRRRDTRRPCFFLKMMSLPGGCTRKPYSYICSRQTRY